MFAKGPCASRFSARLTAIPALLAILTAASGCHQASATTTTFTVPVLTAVVGGPADFHAGQAGSYSITVTNDPNAVATSGTVTMNDPPTGFTVSSLSGFGWACSVSTLTCTESTVLPAGGSYQPIQVEGTVTGSAGQMASVPVMISGGGIASPVSTSGSFLIVSPPTISEVFNPTSINQNASSKLTFTITNPAANTVAQDGVSFADTLTGGLQVAATPGVVNNCGGIVTASAGMPRISLTEGTVGVNMNCTVTVNVTGTALGTNIPNTSGAVSSINGGTGTTSNTATISVTDPPTPAFTIGGTVINLAGMGGGLQLQNQSGETPMVNANGGFTFRTALASGSAYNVSVYRQPDSPAQTCGVAQGSGVVTAANVENVTVNCGHGEWAWINGGPNTRQQGNYGTRTMAAPTNIPGGRDGAASWTDMAGNFWLFGGAGVDGAANNGLLNDLWEFNGRDWIWQGGSNAANVNGTYGAMGAAAGTSIPGGRNAGVTWTDAAGNFWLFGGTGFDSAGNSGFLNDLWEFKGSNWTWQSGSNAAGQKGTYGTKGMAAPANVPGGRALSAGWTDAAGNFWLFGGTGFDSTGTGAQDLNDLWEFDGRDWIWQRGPSAANAKGTYGVMGTAADTNIPGARDSAMSWVDEAGNFWLFGGSGYDSAGTSGYLNDLWEYNGKNWIWQGGSNAAGQKGTYGTKGMASGGFPGARYRSVVWKDASGNIWLFGGYGYDSTGAVGYLNDLWEYSGGNWMWVGGSATANPTEAYGTQGTPGPSNVPGGRSMVTPWTDTSGNLWLFGGTGYDSAGTAGYLNDLWEYQP